MMRIAVFIINPQLEGEGCGWGVLDHIIYNSMPTFSSTQYSMAAVNASTSRVIHINVCHRSSGRPQDANLAWLCRLYRQLHVFRTTSNQLGRCGSTEGPQLLPQQRR